MLNFLDLLIVVVMVMAAVSLLALLLMFLVKNKTVKRVCFYIIAALGVYLGYVGFRILWPGFFGQAVLAVVMALTSIGAFILERLSKDNEQKFRLAQILASLALVVGMFNAFS